MADSRLAFDIIARGGSSAAAEFEKVARGADKAGSSMKKNSAISDAVAKATANLTKAHNAESTALDRVQIAEQKLTEVRGNSNAKVSQVLTAEKSLAKARREAAVAGNVAQKAAKDLSKVLDDEGKKAGKGFLGGLKDTGKKIPGVLGKWFTNSGGGGSIFKQAGQNAGNGFFGALIGVLKTPVIGPVVAGVLVAAVATAAPAVGAVAAGALVTAFGAGLSVLGFVFAAKSKAVRDSWKSSLAGMGRDMTALSKPFEATLIHLSGTAAKTFANLRPQLASAFKVLAPAMSEFGDDLGKALGRLGPALVPLSQATASVLKSLGPGLQDALGKTADGLINLSDSVQKNPDGLAELARGVGDMTNKLLGFIATLNDTNTQIKQLTGASGVDLLFKSLNFTVIGSLDGAFKVLDGTLHGINAVTKPVGQGFHQTATSAQEAATATGYWLQGMTPAQAKLLTLGAAAGKSAHEIHAANVAATLAAGAFDRQSAATQHAIDLLNRYSSRLLTLSGAQISYQQAIDDTTAAIKANGHTHDLNTQKGRDNQTQLNSLTQSVIAQRDAMLNANDGNVKAAKFAVTGRAAFIKFAEGMKYSKAQAQAMATQLIAIPPVSTVKLQANITDLQSKLATAQAALKSPHLTATKKAQLKAEISNLKAGIATSKALLASLPMSRTARIQANIADLEAKLRTAKGHLDDKNLTKERRAKLNADIASLEAQIRKAKADLAGVPKSKTVTITTTYTEIHRVIGAGSKSSGGGVGGGHEIAGRAVGGPVKAGTPYLIGEKGPELMVPSTNGMIIPNNALKTGQSVATGMAQGMLGGGGSAVAAAGQVAAAMIAKARDVLGIASPSKAFAQIGLYVNQGFKIGLLGSAKSVQSAMSSLMSKVLNISFNAADTKKSIQKTITSLNASLAAARDRVKPVKGSSKQRATIERGNRQAEASIRSIQAKLRTARTDLANVNAIASRLGTTVKRNAVLGMLQRENAAMQNLANARAAVAVKLKAAQSKLADAVQVRDEFRKSITDAALSFNNITTLQPDTGGRLAASDILGRMQQTLAATRNFAANLARLKAQGLRGDLYKQIADAGVDAGGATAAGLLQGGKGAVAQANSLQAQIASASAGLGNTAAKNLYQAGVDAAQGLVNGLLAKTKALDAASKKLAAAIVAQIKKTLGIRSPSKVLEWHGSMAGRGFERGILGEYGRVQKAGAGLGAAAIPGRSNSTRSAPSGSSGGVWRIEIAAGDSSPYTDFLVRELRKYVKIKGGNVQQAFG